MPSSDAYDQEVTRLHKKQDWTALERYCRGVERQMRHRIRSGAATENDHRLRLQALSDLQTTYVILERPKEQLRAAQEAYRARRKTPYAPDALDDYFSCTSLARAYVANDQAEKARDMFLCAGASMITWRQAEFFATRCSTSPRLSENRPTRRKPSCWKSWPKD